MLISEKLTARKPRTLTDTEIDSAANDDERQSAREHSKYRSLSQRIAVSAELEESAIGIEDAAEQGHEEQREQSACGRNSPNAGEKSAVPALAAGFG